MKLSESDSILFRFDLPAAVFGILQWQREDSVTRSRPTRRPNRAPDGRTGGPTGGRRGPKHDEVVGGFRAAMEGVSKGFTGASEGFQGFRECDPRQEMVENVGRCAESWIRGRRRRPGEQTPNIILKKEF